MSPNTYADDLIYPERANPLSSQREACRAAQVILRNVRQAVPRFPSPQQMEATLEVERRCQHILMSALENLPSGIAVSVVTRDRLLSDELLVQGFMPADLENGEWVLYTSSDQIATVEPHGAFSTQDYTAGLLLGLQHEDAVAIHKFSVDLAQTEVRVLP